MGTCLDMTKLLCLSGESDEKPGSLCLNLASAAARVRRTARHRETLISTPSVYTTRNCAFILHYLLFELLYTGSKNCKLYQEIAERYPSSHRAFNVKRQIQQVRNRDGGAVLPIRSLGFSRASGSTGWHSLRSLLLFPLYPVVYKTRCRHLNYRRVSSAVHQFRPIRLRCRFNTTLPP